MLTATFSDTTNSAPWSYDVDWGDGARSNGSLNSVAVIHATHEYQAEGSRRVTVTVTNQRGAAGSASATIATTDPVLLVAGDVADCTRLGDDSTAMLLDTLQGIVVPLGDDAYDNGSPDEYNRCYAPTWGRQKARTRPVAGNHDYNCGLWNTTLPGCTIDTPDGLRPATAARLLERAADRVRGAAVSALQQPGEPLPRPFEDD